MKVITVQLTEKEAMAFHLIYRPRATEWLT